MTPATAEDTLRRVYLVRHGETEFNRLNIVQGGGVDSDLNATGCRQALKFHGAYAHLSFSAYYCTGLKRTRQTLAPFEEAGAHLHAEPRLNELNWGTIEGQQPDAHSMHLFREAVTAWDEGRYDHRMPSGESPLDGLARGSAALNDILARHPQGNILICTHGRMLRILLCHLMGYELKAMQHFPHHNTGLDVLQPIGGNWLLERYNDTAHLN